MEIPGFVFILVGAIVSIVSFFLGDKLTFFIYAGFVFIAFGAVKWYIMGKSKNEKVILRQVYPNFRYCRQCNSAASVAANFCGKCGYRL